MTDEAMTIPEFAFRNEPHDGKVDAAYYREMLLHLNDNCEFVDIDDEGEARWAEKDLEDAERQYRLAMELDDDE